MTAGRLAYFVSGILLSAGSARTATITIPVNCNGNQVGVISATNNAASLSGSFSTIPNPPNAGSLAAAAAACGEDHFNWYQIVTADNQAPRNFAGQQLTPPYVDPPPGGYDPAFDNTWADNLPWYYDEGVPTPAAGQVVKPGLSLANNTTATTLSYSDMPGGNPGLNLSFSTWLVSLNKDSSFHAFEGGFSWTLSIAANGTVTVGAPVSLNGANPTAAQYTNIIGGFATSIPEPSTILFLFSGTLPLIALRRKIRN